VLTLEMSLRLERRSGAARCSSLRAPTLEERRNAMNYESPEVVEIGRANEVILGTKLAPLWDEVDRDFTMVEASVLDRDE